MLVYYNSNLDAIVKTKAITLRRAFVGLAGLILAACGGGGDGSSQLQVPTACLTTALSACGALPANSIGSATPVTKASLTLVLQDANGNPANLLGSTGPLTARARLVDASGTPVAGSVVRFTTDAALATIGSASSMSDANGIATTQVYSASPSAAGAGTVSATSSFTPAGASTAVSVSGSANFKVGAAVQDTAASVLLVSIDPADKSILMKNTIGTGRVQTAQVKFRVVGRNGQPIVNQKVRFSFQPANADLTFASNTGVTGQNGEVTAVVNAGNTVTVAAVRITVVDEADNPLLDGNRRPITTISDQITVTNTLLNPEGISLTTSKFLLESINVVGEPAVLTVRLADLQGGGITDGVAIAFTSNGGYIVGSDTKGQATDSARCTTINGSCSVRVVPANPMPPGGIATINAMLQLNGQVITKDIQLGFSGAVARFTGAFDIDATTSCDTRSITFNIADVNGNVMPEGSKLTILGPLNVSGTIVNDTVKYPFSLTGGTVHQVRVTPTSNCSTTGTRIVEGSLALVLTTPSGIESSQVVTIRYRTAS